MGGGGAKKLAFWKIIYILPLIAEFQPVWSIFYLKQFFVKKWKKKSAKKIGKMGGRGAKKLAFLKIIYILPLIAKFQPVWSIFYFKNFFVKKWKQKSEKKIGKMGGGGAKKLAFFKIIYIFTTYSKISARLKHFLLETIFCQKMKRNSEEKNRKNGRRRGKKIVVFENNIYFYHL